MQTQDAPAEFLFKLWPWLEENKNILIGGAAVVVIASGIYYFISSQKKEKEITAGQALTQLLVMPSANTTPKQQAVSLAQLAATYSGTAAGLRARLQAATDYFDLGDYADAQTQFQKCLEANPTGPLLAAAELGVAASLEAQGKLDEAATAYKKVTFTFAGQPGAVPAELGLGRVAEEQGKLTEAQTHYETVARAGNAAGSFSQEAAMHYTEIRDELTSGQKTNAPAKSTAPAASTTPATPVPFQLSK